MNIKETIEDQICSNITIMSGPGEGGKGRRGEGEKGRRGEGEKGRRGILHFKFVI
jgi:hypothetical protein